ncbi:release factor glutamine methyltransferase [Streptomyces sp. WMMB 322]|nr:release factor glutamine methyltransferase [Streptomyces sp. WMMB 322]
MYAPQGDSELLLKALRRAPVPPGARMLDVCTGTGVVAFGGVRLGASEVHAVDLSLRATLTARWNARIRRLPLTVHRGDFLERAEGRFDVVTANPPYVPTASTAPPAKTKDRAWDAGDDGRDCIDRLCRAAPGLLAEGGVLLMVHSDICDTGRTIGLLQGAGLKASVVSRRAQPFGPVLRRRAPWLEYRGLTAPGQREEELVVIRADLVSPGA